jgi:hypothetical protein
MGKLRRLKQSPIVGIASLTISAEAKVLGMSHQHQNDRALNQIKAGLCEKISRKSMALG